jgi:competence protein ComEC
MRGRVPAGSDRNLRSVVLLVRWHGFRALLTGDAEQGFAPVDPGPVDVLKVAHHGSDDPGLGELLDRASPSLAVISVGADNSYGHPTLGTLQELARHRVAVARTDLDGEVEIDVGRSRWNVG